jgi:NTE family protein
LRPGSIRAAFTETFQRFGELNAQKVLKAFMPEQIPGTFEELAIPLKTTSTDFYGNSMTVIDSGPLLPAIAASIAIPAIFKPEIVNGRVHIDGGIANPVAFDLVEAPGRIVVAVDVIGAPRGDDPSRIPSRMETAFGASQLLMHSVIRMKLQLHKPDLLVRPAVSQFRVLDFLHARAIIEHTTPTRVEARTKLARLLETADA